MTCNGDCNQGRECNCECKKETNMKMDIKEMALKCGVDVTEIVYKDGEDAYVIALDQLEKFAQAVIAEFVKEQKPVAWKDKIYGNLHHADYGDSIPLYTTPPSREWVGLSDEEIEELYGDCSIEYFRDIEAKLREKNG